MFKIVFGLILGSFFSLWITPQLYPRNINKPFGLERKYMTRHENAWKGEYRFPQVLYRFDSNGNRTRSPRGEQFRCLLVGGSSFYLSKLNQGDDLVSRFQGHLNDIFLDSYSFSGMSQEMTYNLLKSLKLSHKSYDCVILAIRFNSNVIDDRSEDLPSPFLYTESLKITQHNVIHEIKKRLERVLSKDLLGNAFHQFISSSKDIDQGNDAEKMARKKREEALREGSLKPVAADINEEDALNARENIKKVLEAAKQLAPKTIVISQMIAYSEDEHPEVSKRWAVLEQSLEENETVYWDNESIAKRVRQYNMIMKVISEAEDAAYIDLDSEMKSYLKQSGDFFIDRWHLSERGTIIAGKFLAVELEKLLGASKR